MKQEREIIIHRIEIGQPHRGGQTIQTWINNLKAAESAVNTDRRALVNTYHDISVDGQLTALVEKRVLSLLNVPITWQGLTDERYVQNLESPWFFDLLQHIGKSIFEGYSLVELVPGKDGLIDDVNRIPPANILPFEKLITCQPYSRSGNVISYTLPPENKYVLEVGNPADLGLYAVLAPYVLMKRSNLADFARFNEMFGMPLRWYEYDPNDPTARDKVTEAAKAQGSAAYVVVPKGTKVNFVDAAKTGASSYEPFHDLMNREMSIVVLGQTLTTQQTNVGSQALGEVHQQVETEIAMKDRLMAEYLLNYKLKPMLIANGYPLQGVKAQFNLNKELTPEEKLKMWLEMADAGLSIAKEDLYNEFGVPLPKGRVTLTRKGGEVRK